jgi:hypothetical protein
LKDVFEKQKETANFYLKVRCFFFLGLINQAGDTYRFNFARPNEKAYDIEKTIMAKQAKYQTGCLLKSKKEYGISDLAITFVQIRGIITDEYANIPHAPCKSFA